MVVACLASVPVWLLQTSSPVQAEVQIAWDCSGVLLWSLASIASAARRSKCLCVAGMGGGFGLVKPSPHGRHTRRGVVKRAAKKLSV